MRIKRIKKVMLLLAVLLLLLSILQTYTFFTLTGKVTQTASVSFCFNHPPTIEQVTDKNAEHNFPFTLQINASDPENHSLYYYDNLTFVEINQTNGLINFTPSISNVSQHSVLVTVTDYSSDCPCWPTMTFGLEIYNIAPNFTQTIPNQTWEEDVWLTGLDLDNYFSDPENDSLNYSATKGEHINISINNEAGHVNRGVVTFKPEKDWSGVTWAVFTANDTLVTNSSNNVTLNITHIENYCGDYVCNTGEDCSSCPGDCGSCPSLPGPGGGSGGGGGGKTEIITKIERLPQAICEPKITCSDWAPETCQNGTKQQRICLKLSGNCTAIHSVQEKDCFCQPQWECTIWFPEECSPEEIQRRTCLDANNCFEEPDLPLEKACTYQPKSLLEEKPFVAGRAFFQGITEMAAGQNGVALIVALGVVTLALLLLYSIRRRKPKVKAFRKFAR